MSVPPVSSGSSEHDPEATPPPVPPADAEAFADLAFDEEPEGGSSEAQRPSADEVAPPRRRFKRRLVWRLLLLLLLIVVVPLAVEGGWFYLRTYQESVLLALRREELVLEVELGSFNEWMVQRQARVETALYMRDVRDALATVQIASSGSRLFANARATLLHRLQNYTRVDVGAPLYTGFVLVDLNGRVVVATEQAWEGQPIGSLPFGPSLEQRWTQALTEVQHWVDVNENPALGESAFHIVSTYPVKNDQHRVQGLLVGLSTDLVLQRMLMRMNAWLPDGENALLVGPDQVYTWNASRQLLVLVPTEQGVGQLAQLYETLAQQPQDTVFLEPLSPWQQWLARWGILRGVARVQPYSPVGRAPAYGLWRVDLPQLIGLVAWIEPLNLGLAATSPEHVAVAGVASLIRWRVVVWTAIVGLATVAAWAFGRGLLQRIQNLVQVAEAFAQGQWDARATVVGEDEMALLAYTFNNLADQLQETYATMERELNLRTQQVQLVVTMATVALEDTGEAARVLQTILQRMAERFPRFAYLSLRLWHAPDQGWQPAGRVSRLPQAVNLALRSFEPHLAAEVGRTLEVQRWPRPQITSLRLPPPLTWMIGLPLATPRRLLGVLFVGGVDPTPLSEYDRFALRLLARQLTLVLEYLHLHWGQGLETEKQQVLTYLLQRLPTMTHASQVLPTVVEGLTAAKAQGVLLAPMPQLTDAWQMLYPEPEPESASESGRVPAVRNLLSLVSDGPAHLVVDESESTGLGGLARLHNWQSLGLYPVRDHEERILAVWVRGTPPGASESPADRERERLFADVVGWAAAYTGLQQRLSVWQVVRQMLDYAPEAPSEGHLYLRAWDLLQKHLPPADFFVTSRRGAATYTFIYPYGQRYYHTTVTPLEQALIRQVLERGQPLLLRDKHKIIAQAGRTVRMATRIPQSWLGVPVLLGNQRLGVIGLVQWDKANAFTDEHQAYLTTLAQGLAGVLYYIQQEGRLRKRIEREQSLRSFAQILTGLTDVRNMLDFSAGEILRLFEVKQVEIELFSTPVEDTSDMAPSDDGAEQKS